MRKFEYTTRLFSGNTWEEDCTGMGAQGWEWLSHEYSEGHQAYEVFFKREVDQNAPQ